MVEIARTSLLNFEVEKNGDASNSFSNYSTSGFLLVMLRTRQASGGSDGKFFKNSHPQDIVRLNWILHCFGNIKNNFFNLKSQDEFSFLHTNHYPPSNQKRLTKNNGNFFIFLYIQHNKISRKTNLSTFTKKSSKISRGYLIDLLSILM